MPADATGIPRRLGATVRRQAVALLWAALVAVLLLVPTGGREVLPWPWLELLRPVADKLVHAALFAVLAGLIVRGELSGGRTPSWAGETSGSTPRPLLVTAAALATAWGLLLEIAQAFVPYRGFEMMDGWADLVGAVLGAWWAARRG